jgi:hypothetical protein
VARRDLQSAGILPGTGPVYPGEPPALTTSRTIAGGHVKVLPPDTT